MEKIKVSIVTPSFNSEKTIRKTIENVLCQTYQNIEYIIIDGGSTDSTVEIIREYSEVFNGRLKFISEPDFGIYNAMNKGIKMAKGNLIGIINSDDFYEIDAVEKIVNHMTDDKYQVIYGYCNCIRKGKYVRKDTTEHRELDKRMIPHPTCFITRKTYCRYGMFLEWMKIAADHELMLRLVKKKDVHFIQIEDTIANFSEGGVCTQPGSQQRFERERLILWCMHGIISKRYFIRNYLTSFNQSKSQMAYNNYKLFMLMDCWVKIKQEGKNIADYLKKEGYSGIAIYGMSYVGKRLLDELDKSDIKVKYGIDRYAGSIKLSIPVLFPDDRLEEVSAVIVTAVYYFDEIKRDMERKVDCPIISLEDILYEM